MGWTVDGKSLGQRSISCLLAGLLARSSRAGAGLLTDFDGELLHAEQHFGGCIWWVVGRKRWMIMLSLAVLGLPSSSP